MDRQKNKGSNHWSSSETVNSNEGEKDEKQTGIPIDKFFSKKLLYKKSEWNNNNREVKSILPCRFYKPILTLYTLVRPGEKNPLDVNNELYKTNDKLADEIFEKELQELNELDIILSSDEFKKFQCKDWANEIHTLCKIVLKYARHLDDWKKAGFFYDPDKHKYVQQEVERIIYRLVFSVQQACINIFNKKPSEMYTETEIEVSDIDIFFLRK